MSDDSMTAEINRLLGDPAIMFELAFQGDFYIEVGKDGAIRHFPRPEDHYGCPEKS